MKKKMFGRLSAMAMASAMMVSMFGMSVNAADAPKNVTVKKEITKETNVYTPNTSFTFSVRPAAAGELTGSGKVLATDIPANGVSFSDNSIASTPGGIGETTVRLTDTAELEVNADAFSTPGIYRYVVTEDAGSYDGITYSTEKKFFDVYVNSEGEVYSYMFVEENNDNGKDDGVFTNDYSKDHDTLKDLKIEKEVTGNQGDKNKDFTFTVKIDGETGEQYYMVFSDGTTNAVTLTSGVAATFMLANGESVTIYGLDSDDTYTVTENDYSADGYTTKVNDVETSTDNGTISADKTVTFVNDKNVATPTGVIMTVAPYILIVAAAGVLAALFLRRKRNF